MPGNRVTQPVKGQKGEQGFSIKSASLVGDNLVLQSTSGSSYDVGNVKGATGPAGASGSDISDPNEPDIVVDNFVSLGDGNTSGDNVIIYSFDGEGLLYTNTKTLSSNGAIKVYEADSETDHIGVVQLRCENDLGAGSEVGLLTLGRDTSNIVDFAQLNTLTFVIKTPANSADPTGGVSPTSTNYDLYFGLFDDANNPPTNGIYFRRLNGAAWTPVCKNGGSTTTGTTTAYSSNTWYTLKIRKVSATEVGFTVNTGTEVVISTNIPTGYMNCGIIIVNNTAGSSVRYLKLDFFSLKIGTSNATTTNTIVGTANEVEVTGPVSNVITVGLPNTVIVDQVTVDQLNLDTTLTPVNPLGDGVIAYDPEYQSPIMGLDGGLTNTNITAPLGSALVKLVRNNTGATITKGQVVYITGSHASTHILVSLADASSEATAKDTIGVAAHDIANNTEGWIITQGYLKGFTTNTTTGTGGEGSTLWLSTTAGAFTYDRPTAPDHGVVVGFMVKSAGSGAGSIYVKVSNGQELEELHDVYINSIANNDVLQWDNTDLRWENRSLSAAGIASSGHTHTLNDLSDVTITSVASNNLIQYNGTDWINRSITAAGIMPDPTSATNPVYFVEDFLQAGTETGEVGLYNWNLANGQVTAVNSELNHPGICRYRCSGTANTVSWLSTSNTNNNTTAQFHIDDVQECTIVFKDVQTDLDTYRTYGLLADATNTAGQPNGIYLQKDILGVGSGNWNFVCQRNTVTRTSVLWQAQNTNWHKIRVVITASQVDFYADGATSPTASITTNIPTSTTLAPFIILTPTGTSLVRTVDFDFFSYKLRGITR